MVLKLTMPESRLKRLPTPWMIVPSVSRRCNYNKRISSSRSSTWA